MSSVMNQQTEMTWQPVCQVEDIPRLGGRTLRAGQSEIAVFCLSDGRIMAVDNRCPHKQGPLAESIVSGDTIICPLHARKINLKTGQVQAPNSGCVKTYAVKIVDGEVFLQL